MRGLLLSIILLGCKGLAAAEKFQLVTVTVSGGENKSVERRYYISDTLKCLVLIYNDNKSRDSVCYSYIDGGVKMGLYEYKGNKYVKDTSGDPLPGYYAYLLSDACGDMHALNSSGTIIHELNDLCSIRTSVLPGREQPVEKRDKEGNKQVIRYDSLDAVYLHMSPDFQLTFENEMLRSVKVVVDGNRLVSGEYVFDIGTLKRAYFYEQDKIKKITVTVNLNEKRNNFQESYSYSFRYSGVGK
jgi:hypothetical protein